MATRPVRQLPGTETESCAHHFEQAAQCMPADPAGRAIVHAQLATAAAIRDLAAAIRDLAGEPRLPMDKLAELIGDIVQIAIND